MSAAKCHKGEAFATCFDRLSQLLSNLESKDVRLELQSNRSSEESPILAMIRVSPPINNCSSRKEAPMGFT